MISTNSVTGNKYLGDTAISADFLQAVSMGMVDGASFVRKFGVNLDIQSAVNADVWEYGKNVGSELYTFSADGVADIDSISSSNNGDTEDITVEGLDINGDLVIQTVTLTGQTRKALTTSLWRANRAYNANGVDLLGDVYIYVNTAINLGVPVDKSKIRAYISVGNGQTLQAIYTVPNCCTGYFMGLEASVIKKTAAFAIFSGRTRAYGKVFRTQDVFCVSTNGTSNKVLTFPISLPFSERTDFVPNIDVDSNNTGFSLSFTILQLDNNKFPSLLS
jgi:hypothetical protein